MSDRYFELVENISIEDNRELHAQFLHHLKHVINVSFVPDGKGKRVRVTGRARESIAEIFGGSNGIFSNLYHIEEYEVF